MLAAEQSFFKLNLTATGKQNAMKILLQDSRTQLYLRSLGNWTANHYEAMDFQHSQRAIDFVRYHKIAGVQIVVKFLDSQFDEIVSLRAISNRPRV